MRCTNVSCKRIIEYFKTLYVIVPQRYVSLKPRSSLKILVGLGLGGISIIPSVYAQSDLKSVKKSEISVKEDEQHEFDSNAGWERLKAVYQRDQFGSLSKELTATLQTTCIASVAGAVYGGIERSRIAYRDFMERNQATMFENHLDAKRRLQNHVTIHFGKGALRWSIKLAAFNAGFMFFLTSLLAYRGSAHVTDYMISGSIVGGVLKLRLGPRSALVGAAVGSVLGGFCGLTTKGMFYMTGTSLDDVISFQYEMDQRRLNLFKEIEKKDRDKFIDKQTLSLIKSHDASEEVTKDI